MEERWQISAQREIWSNDIAIRIGLGVRTDLMWRSRSPWLAPHPETGLNQPSVSHSRQLRP